MANTGLRAKTAKHSIARPRATLPACRQTANYATVLSGKAVPPVLTLSVSRQAVPGNRIKRHRPSILIRTAVIKMPVPANTIPAGTLATDQWKIVFIPHAPRNTEIV